MHRLLGLREHPDLFSDGVLVFFIRDEILLVHGFQNVVTSVGIGFRADMRGIHGGSFDRGGQRCALRDRELLHVNPEENLRSSLYAIGAASEVYGVHVHFQDFVLRVVVFNLESNADFFELSSDCLFSAQVGELCQLLRDGAGPFRE